MSAHLQFIVRNQRIKRIDNFLPAADSVNYLRAGFVFETSEWHNVTVIASFKHGDDTYEQILDSNGECFVPWEVINPGTMYVSCHSGSRVTVNNAQVMVVASGYTPDAKNSQEPTPEMYEQILAKIDYNAENIDGGTFADWKDE